MGDFLKLQFLAILQGLTEFLPVSSSGHLCLAREWLGLEEPAGAGPVLELLLHAGTLAAVCYFYRRRLAELISGLWRRKPSAWREAGALVLSCLPAGILYALAHDQLEAAFQSPVAIGILLIINGIILLSLKRAPMGTAEIGFGRAAIMGCAQAIAILPGISRSGATYVSGRWSRAGSGDAFDFAFLMSIPTVGGAVLLKLKEIGSVGQLGGCMGVGLLCATVLAAVVGLLALRLLVWLRLSGRLWLFGTYCLVAGASALLIQLLQ